MYCIRYRVSYTLYPLHNTPWRSTLYREILAVADELQSTPPRGGATANGGSGAPASQTFQSTPPRGGRLGKLGILLEGLLFQSTPPREGRQDLRRIILQQEKISIHAPAWGATAKRKMLESRKLQPLILAVFHQIIRVQVTPTGRAASSTQTL